MSEQGAHTMEKDVSNIEARPSEEGLEIGSTVAGLARQQDSACMRSTKGEAVVSSNQTCSSITGSSVDPSWVK
jgi:hypothetical protein